MFFFLMLGGGFKYFYFHPETWGNDPISQAYFSDGLAQPSTVEWGCHEN